MILEKVIKILVTCYLLLVDDGLSKRQLFSCPYLSRSRPICSWMNWWEGASTTCEWSRFQSLITLWEKKFFFGCWGEMPACIELMSSQTVVIGSQWDESTPSLPDIIYMLQSSRLFFFSSPRLWSLRFSIYLCSICSSDPWPIWMPFAEPSREYQYLWPLLDSTLEHSIPSVVSHTF